jgi:hypothetical protein
MAATVGVPDARRVLQSGGRCGLRQFLVTAVSRQGGDEIDAGVFYA